MLKQKNWPTTLAYILAIIVFLAVSVYTVMYATGYRVDFGTWSIEKTGVLAVTTKPSGATVKIDDKPYSRKTPFTLRNMLPGTYTLTLELEGYRPYTKPIEVVSNRVTEEHNIDLVLNDVVSDLVADNVAALITLTNGGVYFGTDKKFYEVGKTDPLKFDNLPVAIQTILSSTTSIFLANKHDQSNNWVLGVVANGRRWLVIVEPSGYRGQAFQAPLTSVKPEDIYWIDADRLAFVVGRAVYGLDLTSNKLITYHQNATGVTYTQNALYFVQRSAQGVYELWRDANIFDAKPAELAITNLPVGQDYEVLITPEKDTLVMPINRGVKGIWIMRDKEETFTKLDSNIGQVIYDYLNEIVFYRMGTELKQYVLKDPARTLKISGTVHTFDTAPLLLGKRNESLFWQIGSEIFMSDLTVDNLYLIANITNKTLFLDESSQIVWTLGGNVLEKIIIRKNSTNLFGRLPGIWWGENYQAPSKAAG
ncbi:MAG: PEGA domain-containing protein [Patescibacteria group bacterium]|nr:PEGA domain-containing protein [Patescibacteria group bacterium]